MTQEEKPMKNAVEALYEDYSLSLKHNLILKDEILELKKQIEHANQIAEQDGKEYAELLKDFRAVKAKLEKAKEALRFYGDTANWTKTDRMDYRTLKHGDFDKLGIAATDYCYNVAGAKARAALKEIE